MLGFIFLTLNTTLECGGVFLIISPGAAQVGMGMGGVAYPNDIPGIYYNPANVNLAGTGIYIQNTPILEPWNYLFSKVTGFYYGKIKGDYEKNNIPYSPDWLAGLGWGMKYMYGGIVFPPIKLNLTPTFPLSFNIGLNYTYLNTGTTETTIDSQTYSWESFDFAIGLPLGISLFDNMMNVGITPKYVYSFLVPKWVLDTFGFTDASGYAYAFTYDTGLLLKDPFDFFRFGLSYSNIIGFLSYIVEKKEPLPRVVRYGYSISPIVPIKFLLDKYTNIPFDITKIIDVKYSREKLTDRVGKHHEFWDSSGREITLLGTVIFRSGYFSDTLGHRIGGTEGAGIRLGNITMDFGDDSKIYSFYTKNYRLSISIHSLEGENKYYAIPYSVLFPGAGHIYLGRVKRGLIFGGLASIISLAPPYGSKAKSTTISVLFYTISLASIVDILLCI